MRSFIIIVIISGKMGWVQHGEIATRLHSEQLKSRVSTLGSCKDFFLFSTSSRPALRLRNGYQGLFLRGKAVEASLCLRKAPHHEDGWRSGDILPRILNLGTK
jgi:hypothetical protein